MDGCFHHLPVNLCEPSQSRPHFLDLLDVHLHHVRDILGFLENREVQSLEPTQALNRSTCLESFSDCVLRSCFIIAAEVQIHHWHG